MRKKSQGRRETQRKTGKEERKRGKREREGDRKKEAFRERQKYIVMHRQKRKKNEILRVKRSQRSRSPTHVTLPGRITS